MGVCRVPFELEGREVTRLVGSFLGGLNSLPARPFVLPRSERELDLDNLTYLCMILLFGSCVGG